MKYKLHFSNHSLKYIMNSKRECLAISTPFVNILNYKLNKNYELNENYRLTIKIYILQHKKTKRLLYLPDTLFGSL